MHTRILTPVQKYEKWRREFKVQVEKDLNKLFRVHDFIPLVKSVNKWEVTFIISGIHSVIQKVQKSIEETGVATETILHTPEINFGKAFLAQFPIQTLTITVKGVDEDELYSKLFLLKLTL